MLIYLLILIVNLIVVMFIAAGASSKPDRWSVASVFVAILAFLFAVRRFETRQFGAITLLSITALNLLLLRRVMLIARSGWKDGKKQNSSE